MGIGIVFTTVFRIFQFISYLYTAFAFIKYNVLPSMRLASELAKVKFSSRHPDVNWPGRSRENRLQSKLITPVEGLGPFAPRYRGDHVV